MKKGLIYILLVLGGLLFAGLCGSGAILSVDDGPGLYLLSEPVTGPGPQAFASPSSEAGHSGEEFIEEEEESEEHCRVRQQRAPVSCFSDPCVASVFSVFQNASASLTEPLLILRI